MRYITLFGCALALSACITDEEATVDDGGTEQSDAEVTGEGDGGEGQRPEFDGNLGDGEPPPPPPRDAAVDPNAPDGPDTTPLDASRPPPDDHDQLVEALCERMYSCFENECPPFANAEWLPDICDSIDEQPNRVLRDLLDLECLELIGVIFQDEDVVEDYCSDEPPTEACEGVCEYVEQCGADGGDWCPGFCRATEREEGLDCFLEAQERNDCGDFFNCFEQDAPEPEEACEPVCEKRWRCLSNECAPGTIDAGWFEGCMEECFEAPPEAEEATAIIQGLCSEILPDMLREDVALAERCGADEAQACRTLCNDQLGECGVEECQARCGDWNEANHLCLQYVGAECEFVEACLQTGEARQTCTDVCDRYTDCLLEACPPRIIRPTLYEECTAGCLFDVPERDEAELYLNLECRQVREQIYQENRELAPLCEGDREFRPSPEECVAFCESTLAECIGVGGRQFCLGACATLEREQYQCALEAQGDCVAIDACFAQ